MNKRIFAIAAVAMVCAVASAQTTILTQKGSCGDNVKWTYDGKTLTLSKASDKLRKGAVVKPVMDDYDTKEYVAPWIKRKLAIQSVHVGRGITRIGSCAFAGCKTLTEVTFEGTDLTEIGWGAFLDCAHLRNISLPAQLRKIETIAFANCGDLTSIAIPSQCHVEDLAFVNCAGIKSLEVNPTATIGQYVFASEVKKAGKTYHTYYNGEIRRLPVYMNVGNCTTFGISKEALSNYLNANGGDGGAVEDYDYATSDVDTVIPQSDYARNYEYALVIGNQHYRFVPNVPYAIHDARVFAEYCEKTLGIPSANIHVCEDGTKQMILEEELGWLESIPDREGKRLVVYYAGHGVPDTKDNNKAYMLPTDVRGTKPQSGIALDDFYSRLGELAFEQTSVFLDACFSGINRNDESVNEGMRGVEIAAEDADLSKGKMVVFSAAQGNETAQGYDEQGHGLFTYYLLKELQATSGVVNLGTLADYLKTNVSSRAMQLKLRKPQSPSVNTTENISGSWGNMLF